MLLRETKINPPCIIVTDRELALMNALERYPDLNAVPYIFASGTLILMYLLNASSISPRPPVY